MIKCQTDQIFWGEGDRDIFFVEHIFGFVCMNDQVGGWCSFANTFC